MEVAVIKRESVGNGPNIFHENETIAKYEIMDGSPVKGCCLQMQKHNREMNTNINKFSKVKAIIYLNQCEHAQINSTRTRTII
jgi:hypothetical protein